MAAHYVLVDFENIQPEAEALSFLNDERIKIIIFVNAKQKLSVDRVNALQPFGDRVDYVEMSGSGKNALDFLIAFYLGDILHDNREVQAYVVSNDTGFDPLIKHLSLTRPGLVKRVDDVMKIKKYVPALTNAPDSAPPTATMKPAASSSSMPESAALPGTVRQRVVRICTALQSLPITKRPYPASAFKDFIKDTLNDCDLSEQHITGLLNFMTRKELILLDDEGGLKYQLNNIFAGAKGEFISKAPANKSSPKPAIAPLTEGVVKRACDDLKKRGNSKPRTLKTLASTIKAIFKGELSDQQIDAILDFMKSKKIIVVANGTKVAYDLEKSNT